MNPDIQTLFFTYFFESAIDSLNVVIVPSILYKKKAYESNTLYVVLAYS